MKNTPTSFILWTELSDDNKSINLEYLDGEENIIELMVDVEDFKDHLDSQNILEWDEDSCVDGEHVQEERKMSFEEFMREDDSFDDILMKYIELNRYNTIIVAA